MGKLSAKSAFVTIGQQKTGPPKRTGSAKPSFNPSKRRLALPPESLNGEHFAEKFARKLPKSSILRKP